MDSSSHKLYHVHGMDTRWYLDNYLSSSGVVFEEESLKFPMGKLHQVFCEGDIKGDVLVDMSFASFVHHLYSACEYFKDIYILKLSETCIMEVNKWLHTRTGAFDWNHTSSYATELAGNSGQCDEKDMTMKTAVRQVLKYDIEKDNLTDPVVLPRANCIISAWLLETISKDRDDYIKNLRKICTLLTPEGHLILLGVLNATYLMIGEESYHFFKYDEDFVKEVLTGEGFIIDHCDVLPRKIASNLSDFAGVLFIKAHREK